TGAILAVEPTRATYPDAARRLRGKRRKNFLAADPVGVIDHHDEELAEGEILGLEVHHFRAGESRREIVEMEDRRTLLAAQIADAEQLAQPAIGLSIAGIGDDIGRAIGKAQAGAHQIAK